WRPSDGKNPRAPTARAPRRQAREFPRGVARRSRFVSSRSRPWRGGRGAEAEARRKGHGGRGTAEGARRKRHGGRGTAEEAARGTGALDARRGSALLSAAADMGVRSADGGGSDARAPGERVGTLEPVRRPVELGAAAAP